MAILEGLPGIAVSILVDDNPLVEYDNPDDLPKGRLAAKTVLKYIEATDNKHYAIKFVAEAPYLMATPTLAFEVRVDSELVPAPLVLSDDKRYCTEGRLVKFSRIIHGKPSQTSETSRVTHDFRFSTITTVDDVNPSRIAHDSKIIMGMGEIKVAVYRKTRSSPSTKTSLSGLDANGGLLTIAEKALKGGAVSHGTCFGPGRPTDNIAFYDCDYFDGVDNPIAVFVFKYRSKNSLQQLLLIPRTPSPDPFEALNEQEIRDLARQKFVESRGSKVKTEVETERMGKRTLAEVDEVESIDLTGDTMVVTKTTKEAKKRKASPAIDLT